MLTHRKHAACTLRRPPGWYCWGSFIIILRAKVTCASKMCFLNCTTFGPQCCVFVQVCKLINLLNTKRRLLYLKTHFVAQQLLNPSNTKRRLLYLKTHFVAQQLFNPLNMKRRLLYLKTHFVAQQLLKLLNTKRRCFI